MRPLARSLDASLPMPPTLLATRRVPYHGTRTAAATGVHVSATNLGSTRGFADVPLALFDDEGTKRDVADWDPHTVTGSFSWQWGPCCSDGLVLGPFPPASGASLLPLRLCRSLIHQPAPTPRLAAHSVSTLC